MGTYREAGEFGLLEFIDGNVPKTICEGPEFRWRRVPKTVEIAHLVAGADPNGLELRLTQPNGEYVTLDVINTLPVNYAHQYSRAVVMEEGDLYQLKHPVGVIETEEFHTYTSYAEIQHLEESEFGNVRHAPIAEWTSGAQTILGPPPLRRTYTVPWVMVDNQDSTDHAIWFFLRRLTDNFSVLIVPGLVPVPAGEQFYVDGPWVLTSEEQVELGFASFSPITFTGPRVYVPYWDEPYQEQRS